MARTAPGHFIVENLTTTTPPGSPTHGVAYVPAATATADWTGEEGNIAVSVTTDDDTSHTWYFIAPIEGDIVWDKGGNKLYVYDGSSFVDLTAGGGGGGAPTNAQYIVATSDATLSAERVLGGESGVVTIDNGTGGATEIQLTAGGVANAKLADMAQATLKGRASGAGTGVPTDLTATQVRTILNVEDGAAADQNAGEVSFTPTGSISASNVQAAIAEVSGDVDSHVTSLSNPHSTKWTNLGETPSSFTSDARKVCRVNSGATAIEHVEDRGSTFPTTDLYDGRPYYRTDLREQFHYHSSIDSAARWIGTKTKSYAAATNANGVVAASYMLDGPGNQSSLYRMDPMPWDALIYKVQVIVTGTVTGTLFQIRKNGTTQLEVTKTSADTYPDGETFDVEKALFDEGEVPQMRYDQNGTGDSLDSPRMVFEVVRRIDA